MTINFYKLVNISVVVVVTISFTSTLYILQNYKMFWTEFVENVNVGFIEYSIDIRE